MCIRDREKKAVDEVAQKIDIKDTNLVLNYGVAAQKSVATFSESCLLYTSREAVRLP